MVNGRQIIRKADSRRAGLTPPRLDQTLDEEEPPKNAPMEP